LYENSPYEKDTILVGLKRLQEKLS